jgi:hypothetical protein
LLRYEGLLPRWDGQRVERTGVVVFVLAREAAVAIGAWAWAVVVKRGIV